MSDLVLYTSSDGRTRLDLRIEGRTVWLTQLEIAELFQITKQNVSLHAKNIFEDGELTSEATVKESLTVQKEGRHEVLRTLLLYKLDLILAINYRLHTDAIQAHHIPPDVTAKQAAISYAKKADLRNVTLFRKTAREWCDANPGKDGNMRDHADLEQDLFRTLLHELMTAQTRVHELELSA